MISRKFAKDRDLVTNYEVRPNIYANIFTDFGEKNLTLLNEFFSAGSQYLITPTLDVDVKTFCLRTDVNKGEVFLGHVGIRVFLICDFS